MANTYKIVVFEGLFSVFRIQKLGDLANCNTNRGPLWSGGYKGGY